MFIKMYTSHHNCLVVVEDMVIEDMVVIVVAVILKVHYVELRGICLVQIV